MKKTIITILLFISILGLTGCTSNKIFGTWEGKSNSGLQTTFIFKNNSIVSYSNEFDINTKGSYEIKKDKITIKLEDWDKERVYKFEIKNNRLSLISIDENFPSYIEMNKK